MRQASSFFFPVEVVKVVVLGFLRVTFAKYARIRRKFTQKPIFHYFNYFSICFNCNTADSIRFSISAVLRVNPLLLRKSSTYCFFSSPLPVPV